MFARIQSSHTRDHPSIDTKLKRVFSATSLRYPYLILSSEKTDQKFISERIFEHFALTRDVQLINLSFAWRGAGFNWELWVCLDAASNTKLLEQIFTLATSITRLYLNCFLPLLLQLFVRDVLFVLQSSVYNLCALSFILPL